VSISTDSDIERRSISAEDLAVGLRILADLLEAGLPLTHALRTFASVAPAPWRDVATALQSAVREGRGLARALEECALGLPPIVIGLVRAGEAGSGLVLAMRRAAEHAESEAVTRASVRAALAYPALVAVAGVGALGLMLGVVMPRFGAVLSGLDQAMPPLTRVVLDVAAGVRAAAIPGLVLVALSIVALREALNRPAPRRAVHRALLEIPGLGTIRWASASARLAAALGALLESGVTLRQGLRHAGPAIGDAEIAARLEAARVRIDAGDGLGRTFEALGVVTPLAARLVAAGEESGRLPHMLAYAARIEQARAERLTKTGVRLVEPSLILVFAGLVAIVAAAMLQAIYAVRPG
jgi:general secretion pathway protein F